MTGVVGVFPSGAADRHDALLRALSAAYGIAFVPFDVDGSDPSALDAVIGFGTEPADPGAEVLAMDVGTGSAVDGRLVALAGSDHLDVTLRGWSIRDDHVIGVASLDLSPGDEALATVEGSAIWTTATHNGHRIDRVAVGPPELAPDDILLDHFVPGRFAALLPLVSLLDRIRTRYGWRQPDLQASFMMDDPNLHSSRYGYLDFDHISGDAAANDYHLAVATVPLDAWLVRPSVAALFSDDQGSLSLLVHGNNHTWGELGAQQTSGEQLAVAAQSIRRTTRLEHRADLTVDRVMAAPHGRCSEGMSTALARVGFESLCISRPFPWLDRPPAGQILSGWSPADRSNPLPVIQRLEVTESIEQLPLRAFRRQPLVVYGHHWDLADDPDLFLTWAAAIGRLGPVRWGPMRTISRSMVSWRADGDVLHVHPHTRVVEFDAPDGIRAVVVHWPFDDEVTLHTTGGVGQLTLRDGSTGVTPFDGSRVELCIRRLDHTDPSSVDSPQWHPWPIARRLAVEARDRLKPTADRLPRRQTVASPG